MPQIKIHLPKQLLEQAISQQKFEDWQNELEIYLGQDENMARFMEGGLHANWSSQEQDPNHIPDILAGDPDTPSRSSTKSRCSSHRTAGQEKETA